MQQKHINKQNPDVKVTDNEGYTNSSTNVYLILIKCKVSAVNVKQIKPSTVITIGGGGAFKHIVDTITAINRKVMYFFKY